MTDIVLARPGIGSSAESRWADIVPLGIAYLAGTLRGKGLRAEIIDGKQQRFTSIDRHADAIASLRPRYVGLSAVTVDYPGARELARKVKERCETITILGGAHANALPAEAVAESPEFDFVMAGEGELSLAELVSANSSDPRSLQIPGLWYRGKSGEARMSAPPRWNTDLESIPFPAWDMFPAMKEYAVMWERGCPFGCVFCSRNMTRRVRSRSYEHLLEEVGWIVRRFSPRIIYFQDETFGIHYGLTIELLEKLIPIHRRSGVHFTAQTRVDRVTDRLASLMHQAGFTFIELGVESGNPEVLKRSGKAITLTQVEKSVRIAKNNGLKIWLKFIIGLPGETVSTIRDTVKFASRMRPHRVSVSIIVAYPGCDIYNWVKEGKMGYRLLTKEWGQFDKYASASVELENLPYRTMRRWQFLAILLVYLRGFRFVELMRLVWLGRSILVQTFSARSLWRKAHEKTPPPVADGTGHPAKVCESSDHAGAVRIGQESVEPGQGLVLLRPWTKNNQQPSTVPEGRGHQSL